MITRHDKLKVLAERSDYGRNVEIRAGFTSDRNEDKFFAAKPIEFEELDAVGGYSEPMLTLTPEQGQVLIDELWNAGLRPSEGSGSAGSLAATERHLADMKTIAFGLLRKDGMT